MLKGYEIRGIKCLFSFDGDVRQDMGIVLRWDYFQKDTLGKQLVRAADSISANLSEGFGRYHYKENTNFCYYSRGSLYETKTWLTKAHNRNLIPDESYESFNMEIDNIGIKLNNYIKSIGNTSQKQPNDHKLQPNDAEGK